MLTAQIAVTVAAIGFAVYGIYLMGEARHLDRMDESRPGCRETFGLVPG